MKWISLPEEVEVFGSMMNQQLDLRNEVENLIAFENNFSPRKVPVTFPRPLKIWSTNNVLVEEYQDALPMELFLRNGGGPYDDQVATVGLDAFLVRSHLVAAGDLLMVSRRTCYYWTTSYTPIYTQATLWLNSANH